MKATWLLAIAALWVTACGPSAVTTQPSVQSTEPRSGGTLNVRVPSDPAFVELIQAQAKKAGINVDLKFIDKTDQRNRRRKGDFDIDFAIGAGGLADDPDTIGYGRYHSSVSNNYGKVGGPELDRLLEATRRESDPDKRKETMRAVSRNIYDNAWGIEMLHRRQWDIWQPYVKNYKPNNGNQAPYAFAWVER